MVNRVKPKLRGEKWLTTDDRTVILLSRLRENCYEVINERGLLEMLYEGQFRTRVEPPLTEEELSMRGE